MRFCNEKEKIEKMKGMRKLMVDDGKDRIKLEEEETNTWCD